MGKETNSKDTRLDHLVYYSFLIPFTIIGFAISIVFNYDFARLIDERLFYTIPTLLVTGFIILRVTQKQPSMFATIGTLGLVFGIILLIPHWVAIIDASYDATLFFPNCSPPSIKDYYLYVLDCLAKGAI